MASSTYSTRMPAVFVGHGSPMNALDDTEWSRAFRRLATQLPTPKAVLAVSAHWYGQGVRLTGNPQPRTIHDFGGFPHALYQMQYPAPGAPGLAQQIAGLLGRYRAQVSLDWGLDHGTWTVLRHLRPQADLPVLQLSLDASLPASGHLEIGHILAALRDQGVLILGSGNITHNLGFAMRAAMLGDLTTPAWAASLDSDLATALEQRDDAFLTRVPQSDAGRLAHPSPDHYLPLLYVAGAASPNDPLHFPITGFELGSLSMRAAIFGELPSSPTPESSPEP